MHPARKRHSAKVHTHQEQHGVGSGLMDLAQQVATDIVVNRIAGGRNGGTREQHEDNGHAT